MMADQQRLNPGRRKRKKKVFRLIRKMKKKKNVDDGNEIMKSDDDDIVCRYKQDSMFSYCMERNLGLRSRPPNIKSQYLPISCVSKYESYLYHPLNTKIRGGEGAIFNLEFSPDNSYLVAACENKDIAIFDPCIHKKVISVPKAHTDSVNCITFLDTRVFASCSDDTTIALWDMRNLKSRVCSLTGHTNWVKSMNYHPELNILISSAFDNTVRTWKVNEFYGSDTVKSREFIHIPYLTRTDLSCDRKKFIVATTTGKLLVIHNVDFEKSNPANERTDSFNDVTDIDIDYERIIKEKKANRIECLKNFPFNSKPWCIASLQIHPYGWNVLSRYTCNEEKEWSVVHNIQDNKNDVLDYQFLLSLNEFLVVKEFFQQKELFAEDNSKKSASRLHGYIEEPNLAGGFIKEICYNHDGSIICSPFGNGVRLLGFNSNCDSFLDCTSDRPAQLKEVKFIASHKAPVLTTRFARHLPILASGCLMGQVSFYQPRL